MICAASNRALDEILVRIINDGILDNLGTRRDPRAVRFGLCDDYSDPLALSYSIEWLSLNKIN